MRHRLKSALAAVTLVTLTGCSAASQDRSTGKDPDVIKDATQVTVYLNADDVPNLAFWCTGALRWVGNLNTGNDRASFIQRFPEEDVLCGGKPQ